MASLKGWTTATIVRTYIKSAGTSLTDAEIEDFISGGEGFFYTLYAMDSTFTFSASKPEHLVLRHLVNLYVTLHIIAATPQSYQLLDQAGFAADVFKDFYDELWKNLNSTSIRTRIVNA